MSLASTILQSGELGDVAYFIPFLLEGFNGHGFVHGGYDAPFGFDVVDDGFDGFIVETNVVEF